MSLNVATLDQMSFAVFSEETPLKQKTVFYFVAFVRKCLHIVLIRQKTVKIPVTTTPTTTATTFTKVSAFTTATAAPTKDGRIIIKFAASGRQFSSSF